METRGIAFKLDENLSRHLQSELENLGFDVSTAADEGLLGRPDADIASAAKSEERILLTLDLDFADVVRFPPGTHPGIILFRPSSMGPGTVNRFVTANVRILDFSRLAGSLVVVEPARIRVRPPSA